MPRTPLSVGLSPAALGCGPASPEIAAGAPAMPSVGKRHAAIRIRTFSTKFHRDKLARAASTYHVGDQLGVCAMRGARLAPPIISTYAVGARPLSRSPVSAGALGRSFTLPAVAILGTASALAIVWAWPETEIPANSNPTDERRNSSIAEHSGSRSENPVEPGFSFSTESSQFPADSARSNTELAGSAVQARAALPARGAIRLPEKAPVAVTEGRRPLPADGARSNTELASSAVQARATLPARGEIRLPEQAPVATTEGRRPLNAPVYSCLPSCSGAQAGRAEVASRSDGMEADSRSLVPPAGHPAETPSPGNLAATASAADIPPIDVAADATSGDDLLVVDAPPSGLIEPAGELGVARTDPGPTVELEADLAASGVNVAALQTDGSETFNATSGQRSSPPIETGEDVRQDEPSGPIALHLRRIGERYSSASVSEPAIVAEKPNAEPDRPATRTDTSAPPVAVAVDAASGAVVIQEDALVAIQLGELVSLFEDRLDRPLFVWMRSSAAASKFATSETLAAAGIRTEYDPQRKQIVFSVEDD